MSPHEGSLVELLIYMSFFLGGAVGFCLGRMPKEELWKRPEPKYRRRILIFLGVIFIGFPALCGIIVLIEAAYR